MRDSSAIERLQRLWDRVQSLSGASSERIGGWRSEVLSTLDDIFGSDSDEKHRFLSISFDIDAIRLHERIAQVLIEERVTPMTIEIPVSQFYEARLAEAGEVILSAIVSLRQGH